MIEEILSNPYYFVLGSEATDAGFTAFREVCKTQFSTKITNFSEETLQKVSRFLNFAKFSLHYYYLSYKL